MTFQKKPSFYTTKAPTKWAFEQWLKDKKAKESNPQTEKP